MPAPHIVALVVAGGTGVRAGGEVPKQYAPVAGKALLMHSVEALLRHPAIAAVQVVIHPDHATFYEGARDWGLGAGYATSDLLPPIHGGATRAESVQAGLAALAARAPDYVLIHDAARPFLSQAVIDRIVAALPPLSPPQAGGMKGGVGVVPALKVHDTVRRFSPPPTLPPEGGGIDGWQEVPREGLLRMQTPQAFPFAILQEVTGCLGLGTGKKQPPAPSPQSPTDEAAIWLAAGHRLVYVEGDEELRKVTTAEDIAWAQKHAPTRSVVGMGFDAHALMPSGTRGVIRLGGVDIPCEHKLHGHSDADVVLHALVDALLGAMADGDIGQHFPPGDDRWKGADSGVFVTETLKKLHARGGSIAHVDLTIICEMPKIAPHRDAMRARVAALLDVPLSRVSIKATTTELLGFTGRGEGIAAQAVATVTLPEETL